MSLRIAVSGLAATYPYGGVFWDYLQYPLGLLRLGHDVLYVEDTGKWCYDPRGATFTEDGARSADLLARRIDTAAPEMRGRWFVRDATGRTYGRRWEEVARFCRQADVFLNVSASCWMRDEYFAAQRVVFVDTDPMYTQASVPDYLAGTTDEAGRARIDMLLRHDSFFTFAANVGAPDCLVPTGLFDWIPTRQPVVLDYFRAHAVPVDARRRAFTTVASWDPVEATVVVQGVTYPGKGSGFERFLDLPARSSVPLRLALSGRLPLDRLRSHGWTVDDATRATGDPRAYRRYLATSLGEWSVAKPAYVASRSGWFSCRSACYLALGVPTILQDTGFGRSLPTGEGVLAFSTPDEACDAIERVATGARVHAAAAEEIAAEYFDSDRVLEHLLREALA